MDFGSTFTKAALVDVATGELLASASHRTTIDTDVLDGWDACLAQLLAVDPRARGAEVLACSSAGGGLRIAVVGNEALVTAEAGRRVALSSGGRVVHVASGGLTRAGLARAAGQPPRRGAAGRWHRRRQRRGAAGLRHARWPGPAGGGRSWSPATWTPRPRWTRCWRRPARRTSLAGNVVPQIGVLAPDSARAAIREMFLRHVIGGKHLSKRADFTAMVRGATPDVVLTAVELLADGLDDERPGAGDVVVVDVGGATTDVHSVVELDPEDAGLAREVVATVPVSRTVEGDLGMRWSAVPTVEEGLAAGLVDDADRMRAAAGVRRADPAFLPGTEAERRDDEAIAAAAVGVALRRHAGRSQVAYSSAGRVVERSGKDLREIDVLVGSGGVLRNNPAEVAERVLGAVTGDDDRAAGSCRARRARWSTTTTCWPRPGCSPRDHPEAAHALLARLRGTHRR